MPERGLCRFKSTRRLFTFASGGEDLRVRRSTDPPHRRRRTVFIFHIILIDVSPPFGFYPFRGSFQSEASDRHLIGRCNFFVLFQRSGGICMSPTYCCCTSTLCCSAPGTFAGDDTCIHFFLVLSVASLLTVVCSY